MNEIGERPATTWSRIVHLPVCYSKTERFKIYRIIILPVLYMCETWSLTRREEHSLRMFEVFENRMLRVFWPKGDKVRVDLGRVNHEKHSSPSITQLIKSRRMRWAGHVAWMGGIKRCIEDFGGTVKKETIWKTEV
jgi:hypothetical protein